MEPQLKKELADKIEAARSVAVFMFNHDGSSQGFYSGDNHELMVTLAGEMKKSPVLRTIIQGAIHVYTQDQAQQS